MESEKKSRLIKMVAFKASAAIPRIYRPKFQRYL